MGQKVHPIGFRVGVTDNWRSRWYASKKNFGTWVVEDAWIREYTKREYGFAGIARVDIERIADRVRVILHAARPGLVIGKRGAKVDKMSEDIGRLIHRPVEVDVKEIETPELNSQIVAEAISEQLEKRSPYRRTMRRYGEMIMNLGAQGVKIMCKGRLNGAEIARCEQHTHGKVPLSTLRADIDYGYTTAILSKGTIGVKVWIYKGDKFREKKQQPTGAAAQE